MVFTPITGLGGRVVVPRAGRSTPTRATSSVSASHGGHGGGNNGLRRTGGTGGTGGDSGGRARLVLSGASLVGSLLLGASPAAAAPKKGGKNSKLALPELTNVDLAKQMSSTTALSAAVGYGSALLVKTLATGAFIILAGTFAFIKWLELQGLITIQWDNVKAFAQKQMKVLDVNHDGTLDAKDAQVALSRFEGFMATTVPSSAGFAAGFAMGMR